MTPLCSLKHSSHLQKGGKARGALRRNTGPEDDSGPLARFSVQLVAGFMLLNDSFELASSH